MERTSIASGQTPTGQVRPADPYSCLFGLKEIRTKQLLSVLSATEAVKLGEIINRN
ncbi:hypothetical protein PARMER_00621 [Parabacteroides merdae ATCC 43184]|nr:hypothetical protein PARMER_00621 [Parabacteroides merdae ATCC 43184]